jgi:hypothetical protein
VSINGQGGELWRYFFPSYRIQVSEAAREHMIFSSFFLGLFLGASQFSWNLDSSLRGIHVGCPRARKWHVGMMLRCDCSAREEQGFSPYAAQHGYAGNGLASPLTELGGSSDVESGNPDPEDPQKFKNFCTACPRSARYGPCPASWFRKHAGNRPVTPLRTGTPVHTDECREEWESVSQQLGTLRVATALGT